MPGSTWCPHPADNSCQQGSSDSSSQVTEQQREAQEGLSHPDCEAAQENKEEQWLSCCALWGAGGQDRSLTSLARGILALGETDVLGKGVTHPPAKTEIWITVLASGCNGD